MVVLERFWASGGRLGVRGGRWRRFSWSGHAWRQALAASGGSLEVGFWIEKIEKFGFFWDRPKSIGDAFEKRLGWFWRDSELLVLIWECVAMLSICAKGLAQTWPVGAIVYI